MPPCLCLFHQTSVFMSGSFFLIASPRRFIIQVIIRMSLSVKAKERGVCSRRWGLTGRKVDEGFGAELQRASLYIWPSAFAASSISFSLILSSVTAQAVRYRPALHLNKDLHLSRRFPSYLDCFLDKKTDLWWCRCIDINLEVMYDKVWNGWKIFCNSGVTWY